MIKVAFIGAGGIGWTRTLVRDILTVPELRDTEIALTDIDADRLAVVERVIRRDIDHHKLPAAVAATTDRRAALKDADFVINAVRVGGMDLWRHDVEIPLKYGVDQCIGDTLGPGGIMNGMRSVPVTLEFCRDIREVAAPGAWFLNYVNPMSIVTWAALQEGGVNTLGLCHGVQHTCRLIADVLGLPVNEMDFTVGGVNHMTWFTRLLHRGRDVTARLPDAADTLLEKYPAERVRADLLRRTGYFMTESSGFTAELVPWYRKRPADVQRWSLPGRSHHGGETAGGWRFNMEKDTWFRHLAAELDTALEQPIDLDGRTYEHASYIIEALVTGRTYHGWFNVRNGPAITNLPADAIVETPAFVNREGVHVPAFGALPDVCAGLCAAMVSPQRLAVTAALTGDVDSLRQAMLLDPLTAAVCGTSEIEQMTDALLVAQADYLPRFAEAIPGAKARLAAGEPLGNCDPWPPTRYVPRSIEEMTAEGNDLRDICLSIFTGQHVRAQ
ncbi:MAG: alpha-galactosidase [Lentisphaerae bacterium]|nr:alpha-galactosidase [Lentisphaerota bacterium]